MGRTKYPGLKVSLQEPVSLRTRSALKLDCHESVSSCQSWMSSDRSPAVICRSLADRRAG